MARAGAGPVFCKVTCPPLDNRSVPAVDGATRCPTRGPASRRSGPMSPRLDRRQFLKSTAGATAGLAWLAARRAPAFAQKRELTFLSWNHFVPASDDELRRPAAVFRRDAGGGAPRGTIAPLH